MVTIVVTGLIVCWEKDSKAETIEKNKSVNSVPSELVNYGFDQPLPVGSNTVYFRVDQGPVNPVNLNFGTHVEISKKMGLVADVRTNFDDMNSLIFSFIYRF